MLCKQNILFDPKLAFFILLLFYIFFQVVVVVVGLVVKMYPRQDSQLITLYPDSLLKRDQKNSWK